MKKRELMTQCEKKSPRESQVTKRAKHVLLTFVKKRAQVKKRSPSEEESPRKSNVKKRAHELSEEKLM